MQIESGKLKQYLLDNLAKDETEAIDLRLISEEGFAEEIALSETELIEDYLEGALTDEEVRLFQINFMTSPERKQNLDEVELLIDYASQKLQKKTAPDSDNWSLRVLDVYRTWTVPIRVGVACLLLVLIGAGLYVYLQPSFSTRAMVALNNAYSHERPVQSRITGFNYAPFSDVRSEKIENVDRKERERAELLLLNADRDRSSVEITHTLGRLYLSKKEFDRAIEELEKANQGKQDSNTLNDLGAAYVEKFKARGSGDLTGQTALLVKGLELFDKAIELKRDAPELYFNRAGCLELLNLPNQAKEAWEKYLELDSSSAWAVEARIRLKQLESRSLAEVTADKTEAAFFAAYFANNQSEAFSIASRNREMIRENYLPQKLAFSFIHADAVKKKRYSPDFIFWEPSKKGIAEMLSPRI